MPRVRLLVPVLCAVALALAVALVSALEGRHARSGQASLAQSAQALRAALSAPRVDAREVGRFLTPGTSVDDPRVRRVLSTLAGAVAGPSVVSRVTVDDAGRTGETVIQVGVGRRSGPSGALSLSWVRRPDGGWAFDPLPR